MMLKYRKFFTTAVGFSFLVVGTTGVIFKLFFKNHPMEEIHGWLGLAMVAAAIIHIVQNWGPLKNHFKDQRVFLLLVPIVAVIFTFSFSKQDEDGERRGPNPRMIMHKMTEAKVADVAAVFGKNTDQLVNDMKKEGLHVRETSMTIEALARENQKSPEAVLGYFVR